MLQSLSKNDGIAAEIKFRSKSFDQMKNWNYSQEAILELRFEDLASRNYETLLKAFEHLGVLDTSDYRFSNRLSGILREFAAAIDTKIGWSLPARLGSKKLPAPEFLTIAWRNRFQAQAQGRTQGTEDVGNHYRKGESGDWISHFTDEHIALFKQLYPGLVPKLGYSDEDSW